MADPFLELVDISKQYPGVLALDRVSLSVSAGEVVGLIGENGAGKSTLMKILGGVTGPDAGAIRVDGENLKELSVAQAIESGIAFVHQELNLFENLDVAANIYIGREPTFGGIARLVDQRRLHRDVEPLLERLSADFSPDTPVADLSLAQRQLVEIIKALSLNARLVIMDEPTSSLTITETTRLMRVIGELKAQGVGVVFISHRLNEVIECADRVVVLRDGRVVGQLNQAEVSHATMIRLMIGRDLKSLYVPPQAAPGPPRLEIENALTGAYPRRAVSLSIRAGEILGLAGLVGSGRTELARAVFGIDPLLGGSIRINGVATRLSSPREAIRKGVYLVPEDRKASGLFLDTTVAQNISLPDLMRYARFLIVHGDREVANAEDQKTRLNIRTPSVRTNVGALSGGNQQKVVLAKWLSMRPHVIIFDEPTRGIDVGAKNEIYSLMRELADAGVAILMISSDMEEVIGVSDRVAVMHEGAISGFLDRKDFSEQNVLQLAVGANSDARLAV